MLLLFYNFSIVIGGAVTFALVRMDSQFLNAFAEKKSNIAHSLISDVSSFCLLQF